LGIRKRIATIVSAVVLATWSLVPIYWFVNMSLMYELETNAVPPHFIPQIPTINNFLRVLGFSVSTPFGEFGPSGYYKQVLNGISNSLTTAVIATLVTMAIAIPVAYAFGRIEFKHKSKLLLVLLGSRALPPISIAIPYFFIYSLVGLIGTTIGLVIIYLSITIPIITWILMGFFATLPKEVERASRVDGCTRLMAIRKVMIPMAASGIAAVSILTFLLCWNEFLFAWIFTGGTNASTLPPVLPSMLFMVTDVPAMSATTVISIIPPILISIGFGRFITRLKIVDPVTAVA